MEVKRYWLEYDEDGNGHVKVELPDGTEDTLYKIWGAQSMDTQTRQNNVDFILKFYNVTILPEPEPEPKPKRKYTRHSTVTLGLASEKGKISLKLAKPEPKPKKVFAYILYLKGTDQFVWRINEKGIYVAKSEKTRPVYFTANDIKRIRNVSEFDIKKVEYPGKYIKDKLGDNEYK